MERNLTHVPIESITDQSYRVREGQDREAFEDLCRSVRTLGILQPLLLAADDQGYTVVAGHRRYQAAKEIGLSEVPAIIVDPSVDNNWQICMAENLVRLDLTPMETAAAVKDMIEIGELTAAEVSHIMHRGVNWVADQIEINAWPIELQQAIHERKLSVAAARPLANIEDAEQRKILTIYAVENGATARTTAAWLQAYRAGIPREKIKQVEPLPGQPNQPSMEPYMPCVICDTKLRMQELRYLPICPECQETVIAAVRRELRGGAR